MSLKRFNLNKLEAASAMVQPKLTATDMLIYTSNSDGRTDKIMRSVLNKKEISRKDFNKGAVNAGIIFLGREYKKAADQLAQRTLSASPKLDPSERSAVRQMSYYVQLPDQSSPFRTGYSYAKYEKNSRPKALFKDRFFTFVKGLNDLYKKNKTWISKFTVVNGVPDSPYFVPVETQVAIPNNTSALPLGFSYDESLKTVRIYYIITGDVMFGYVYDDPEEALKGRFIHSMMLDWALSPEQIAAMYQKWYGSPKLYDIVFKELHKEKFGYYPKLRILTPALTAGGEILSKAFPDWRDQRVIRDTILSNFAGLSGIKGNSDFNWELHEELVNGQKANISGANLQNNLFSKMDIYAVQNKSQFNNIPDAPEYIKKIIQKQIS